MLAGSPTLHQLLSRLSVCGTKPATVTLEGLLEMGVEESRWKEKLHLPPLFSRLVREDAVVNGISAADEVADLVRTAPVVSVCRPDLLSMTCYNPLTDNEKLPPALQLFITALPLRPLVGRIPVQDRDHTVRTIVSITLPFATEGVLNDIHRGAAERVAHLSRLRRRVVVAPPSQQQQAGPEVMTRDQAVEDFMAVKGEALHAN